MQQAPSARRSARILVILSLAASTFSLLPGCRPAATSVGEQSAANAASPTAGDPTAGDPTAGDHASSVGELPDADEPYRNVIRWATASEVDNFGYDVYRSEREEGPFERITSDPITGAGTTDEPSEYHYEDRTIDPHKRYYYYVESISMHGDRQRFTPVYGAKPKLPAAAP